MRKDRMKCKTVSYGTRPSIGKKTTSADVDM